MSKQYKKGLKRLEEVTGTAGPTVVKSFESIAPDLGKYIIEFAFGEVISRPGLELKQRQLLTLSSLVTQGDTGLPLEVHSNASLNVGLTPNEIVEAIIHLLPYVGFPKVQNAIAVVEKVFKERGVAPVWENEKGKSK